MTAEALHESSSAAENSSPLTDLRHRAMRLSSTCELFRALIPDKNPLSETPKRLAEIEALWERASLTDLSAVKVVEEIRTRIEVLERETLDAESRWPMASFRFAFDERKLAAAWALDFAELLAVDLAGSQERRERIEFLITRLISFAGDDGNTNLLRPEEAKPIIERVSKHRASDESRAKAIAFFHEANTRLEGYLAVEEIFDGGLLLDLQGYRRAVGRDILDPEIMFASAAINVAIGRKLYYLARLEGLPAGELNLRLQKLDSKLRAIFREARILDQQAPQRFARVIDEKPVANAEAVRHPARTRSGRWLFAAFQLSVIAAAVVVLGSFWWSHRETTRNLSPAETAKISEYLASASVAGGEDASHPRLLVGSMRADWMLLSRHERRREAKKLLDELVRRRMQGAMIFDPDGHQLLLQTEGARVVVLE